MPSDTTQPGKAAIWTGRVLSALPVLMLTMSAVMKLVKPPMVVEGMTKYGFSPNLAIPLGIIELLCCVLYVIPKTSVIGAILLTGFLGGAIATHVRLGDPAFITVTVLALLVWAGLALRNKAVRDVLLLQSN